MSTGTSIVSASVSDRGLSEKRPQNEDSFLEIPQRGIFAVADGVGGAEAGEVASQMAMEILGEAFTNFADGSDAEEVMRIALQRANAAIYEMANELPQLSRMATTVVALHIAGDIATIGHVGDSRLYRIDGNGRLYRETDDHSVVAEEVRAGRMTEEQAENHPSKNIISRALGAEPAVDIELKTIMFEPGTTFLLCSDGVTRHIPDAELERFMASGAEPATICEHIRVLCYERGAEDNLTAVIARAGTLVDIDVTIPYHPLVNAEEATVATTRGSFETEAAAAALADDEDELLEIGTADLTMPEEQPEVVRSVVPPMAVDPFQHPASVIEPAAQPEADIQAQADSDMHETIDMSTVRTTRPDSFSMFGDDGEGAVAEKPGFIGAILKSVGLLLLGGVIGLASYYFVLAPKAQSPVAVQQTEMRSGNEPLTAFEENRRTVDKMPAEALARFGADPRDAEDFFLVGRAHLLLGHYPEARQAFTTSLERIAAGNVEPSNAKSIQTEIAIEMTVTSDSTIRGILEKNLSTQLPAGSANTAANAVPSR